MKFMIQMPFLLYLTTFIKILTFDKYKEQIWQLLLLHCQIKC